MRKRTGDNIRQEFRRMCRVGTDWMSYGQLAEHLAVILDGRTKSFTSSGLRQIVKEFNGNVERKSVYVKSLQATRVFLRFVRDGDMDLKMCLLDGTKSVGIWGLGYIGLTTAMAYAKAGVHVLGYDINQEVVAAINRGVCLIPNLEKWVGYTVKEMVDTGRLHAINIWPELKQCDVHFIAVPTEKDGEPWMEPLEIVMSHIKSLVESSTVEYKPLVIIESTLVPGTAEKFCCNGYYLCVSPRRDFFHKPELNIGTLKRVFATDLKEATPLAKAVLEIVSPNLIEAGDLTEAELVKSVENSLLHVPAVYAMQLARAYPNVDVRKVLQLASTHWRIPLYYPSIGTGGYCIPTSTKYVMQGAEYPHWLTIGEDTVWFDDKQPKLIADLMSKCKRVFVMGICYKGDIKVHKGSPALPIIKTLRDNRVKVYVTDPYYSWQELENITGAVAGDQPSVMGEGDGIIVITDHQAYRDEGLFNSRTFTTVPRLDKGVKILDNYGVWERYRSLFKQIGADYHVIGDIGWSQM